jgi:hypothetical protein
VRAKHWTIGFAGLCHREMPPIRVRLGGRERIAILYERTPKASGGK